jgi:hypothetical protein
MSGFRFSIASFLAVVTLCALGLAALVSQSPLASSGVYTCFVALLCVATAGAVLRPFPTRCFWVGFAIFGWTYWFVEFDTTAPANQPTRWPGGITILGFGYPTGNSTPSRPGLITRELIHLIEENLTPNRQVGAKVMAQWRNGTYYPGTIVAVNGEQYHVQWDDGSAPQWTPSSQIAPTTASLLLPGHSLLGGLFALLGGIIVALIFGRPAHGRRVTPSDGASGGPGTAA